MSAARRILIAGNWKMNGLHADGVELAAALADKLDAAGDTAFDMLVCPPYTLISTVVEAVFGTLVLRE